MTPPEENTPTKPVMIAVGIALIPFAILVARFNFVCDDAYISFRYAQNFANGLGLRYNLGTDPPIEGYTNFLWVLLMAVVEFLRLDPALWSRVLSIPCAILLAFLVTRFARRRLELDFSGTLATALFFVTLPCVDVWATSGLAAMPLALCVFGVYERLTLDPERPHAIQAGLWAVVCVLVRSDGPVWLTLIFGLVFLSWLKRRDAALFKALFVAGVFSLVAFGAHVLFRISYYDDWLPNTARVKVLGTEDPEFIAFRRERGLNYVITYYLTVTSSILVPLIALGGLFVARLRGTVLIGLVATLGAAGYCVMVGGDFMTFGRFLVPTAAFSALLFASAYAWIRGTSGARLAFASVFAYTCIVLSILPSYDTHLFSKKTFDRFHFRWNDRLEIRESERKRWEAMDHNARLWKRQALIFREYVQPGESMTLGAFGVRGYYTGLTIHDTLGLINKDWETLEATIERKSPGHDVRIAYWEFIKAYRPTYLGMAFGKRGEDPRKGIDGVLKEYPVTVEVLEPAAELDEDPDAVLRVLRLQYDE